MPVRWKVVGGGGAGGILVRKEQKTSSEQLAERLATGATVDEVELVGERLHYKLALGQEDAGPEEGWVSISLKEKPLLRRIGLVGSLQPVPGAEGLWEATEWSEAEGWGAPHDFCFAHMVRALRKEAKAEAEELDAKYKKGEFPPCIYVERMMAADVPAGGLLLYSVLPISPELKAFVDENGGCKVIVVPNQGHALHHAGWMEAYPDALVICPEPDAPRIGPVIEALGERACTVGSDDAKKGLEGFEYDDLDGEIVLVHKRSKSFLGCDSIYLGCADKQDRSGWKKHTAPEWARLYFTAFCEKSPSHLPMYRMMIMKEKQKPMAEALQRILAWAPERVLASRSGKTSQGGAAEAAAILKSHWGWCAA